MKIIQDDQRQINLHPLMIYFVMSSKDNKEKMDAINQLNKYQSFTRGLFKFQFIERIGKYSDMISNELTDSIKRYNMFVRLVSDNEDSFFYAVHKVNFNLSSDEVEYSIINFIQEVCKQNIERIKSEITKYTLQGNLTNEKKSSLLQMQSAFYTGMTMKNVKHGIWARLMGEESLELRPDDMKIGNSNSISKWRAEFEEKFEKAKKIDNSDYLWSWVESHTGAPDRETSDEIAKGYYNSKYDKTLKGDLRQRNYSNENTFISLEIKKMLKPRKNSAVTKEEYGLIFHVNGDIISLFLNNTDIIMLYTCILLRRKMGERLYLHELYNNSKGTSSKAKFKRSDSQKWLESVYKELFGERPKKSFQEWIEMVRNPQRIGHAISVAKSGLNSILNLNLDQYPSCVYYCSIGHPVEDELADSYYTLKASPDNIIVPKELQKLLVLPTQKSNG